MWHNGVVANYTSFNSHALHLSKMKNMTLEAGFNQTNRKLSSSM